MSIHLSHHERRAVDVFSMKKRRAECDAAIREARDALKAQFYSHLGECDAAIREARDARREFARECERAAQGVPLRLDARGLPVVRVRVLPLHQAGIVQTIIDVVLHDGGLSVLDAWVEPQPQPVTTLRPRAAGLNETGAPVVSLTCAENGGVR
jgi:hypothetical protein